MLATLEAESTLTDRYQTTVPETVRRALKLGKRDKLHYTVRADGEVVITRVSDATHCDPLLGDFLNFLANDIARHPDHLLALDSALLTHIQSLVGQVELDLNAPLSADDE